MWGKGESGKELWEVESWPGCAKNSGSGIRKIVVGGCNRCRDKKTIDVRMQCGGKRRESRLRNAGFFAKVR